MDRQEWEDPTLLKDRTVNDVITAYNAQMVVPEAKRSAFKRLAVDMGALPLSMVTQDACVAYGRLRASRDESSPATVALDLTYLRGLIKFARVYMKLPASLDAITNAMSQLRDEKIAGKSNERDRRPTDEELATLKAYWTSPKYLRVSTIPMWTLTAFACETAMRLGEITRIRWKDLDRKHKTVIIRDRKHPTEKKGNDQEVPLLPGAWALLPEETDERIFPYNARTISTSFGRTCHLLNIEGLRFHDFRHEAISRLFESGYQIQEVAIFSGHRSWSMLKRYTNLRAKDIRRV